MVNNKPNKKYSLIQALYAHCAEHGMSKLQSISEIAKILGIKRQLFYFYFKDLETCIQELVTHHKEVIDCAYDDVKAKQLDFIGYVHYMYTIRDAYFFSMQCIRYQALHKGFTECLQHSLATMDQYNCKQFILYYDLSDYPEEQMQFMYGSFREYWWSHSGEYKDWSHTKIDELTEYVDSLVNVLKEKQ